VRVGGSEVRYASVEDLIIHKIVAGRPRDIEDVRGILLKNPAYDTNDVRRWLKHFEEITDSPLLAALSDLQRGDRR
jgi:predicted nucleotidyltransferase